MAEVTAPVPSLTQELEKMRREITCPKCNKHFVHPKLLPCHHSVCASCLVIREGVREGLRYMVSCPECSTETELPKSGISSLPTAFFKTHMVEAYLKLEAAEGKQRLGCEECNDPKSLVAAYCDDCQHLICSECVLIHQRMKSLSLHKLESFKEYREKLQRMLASSGRTTSSSTATTALSCTRHGEPLKMYCKTCNVLICKDCTKVDHMQPRHKYNFINVLIKGQKNDVHQGLALVKEIHSVAVNAVSDAKRAQETLSQQEDEMCATINGSFTELYKMLEACKQKLLESAKHEVSTKLGQLTDGLKRLEIKTGELDCLIQVCDQTLDFTNDHEFMSLKRHLVAQLKEVSANRQQYTPKAVVPPSLSLPITCTGEITSTFLAHAEVYHSPSWSDTSVSIGRAEVGKESQVTIYTRYGSGRACIEKQDIAVDVVRPRSAHLVPSSVALGIELGTYIVSYIPEARGRYEISVKISGEHIANSPFCAMAKPPIVELNTPHTVIVNQEWPWGIANYNGETYITKNSNHTISVINKDGRQLKSLGIKGSKVGQLLSPTGIALDREGFIYVADGNENGRLQKLNKNGQFVAIFNDLTYPCGVLLGQKKSRVYVCDKNNQRIVVLDMGLNLVKTFGELSHKTGDFHVLTGTLHSPHSIAEDCDGNLYVTDTENSCIQVFDVDGNHQLTITNPHSAEFGPTGICIEGDLIYVADCVENQLIVFRRNGEFVNNFGGFGKFEGQFYTPMSVTSDADGYLYVCDHCNCRIQVF